MKKILIASAILLSSMQAHAQTNMGVSVSVGDPGFYGTIDIGNYPRQDVVYVRPVVISPQPVAMEPVYMHVPPGQARHWSRYCDRYDACGRPVYFVRDNWYDRVYVPEYRQRVVYRENDGRDYGREHEHGRGREGGWNRGHGHGHDD
jgi:hypothetical protein